jgi:SOS-response transcriptional repressor LexA
MSIRPDRFIEARNRKGWDQEECGKHLNISQQAISDIEIGKTKNPRNMGKMAHELGVTEGYLRGETDEPNPSPNAIRRPRVILSIEEVKQWLRKPIITKEHRTIYMTISEKNVSKSAFFVKIEGDAMISPYDMEKSYFPGHYAFVDPLRSYAPGDDVLVETEGATKFRQVGKDGTELVLEAFNPKYPNIKLDKKVEILGVVLWSQKFRTEDIIENVIE